MPGSPSHAVAHWTRRATRDYWALMATRVFISWSSGRTRPVAERLANWLSAVLDATVYSPGGSISAGAAWIDELDQAFREAEFGVLCVDRDSMESPWLMFELGAIAKGVKSTRVIPLLIDVRAHELRGPLSWFQALEATHDGLVRLVEAMNQSSGTAFSAEALKKRLAESAPLLHALIAEVDADGGKRVPQEVVPADVRRRVLRAAHGACAICGRAGAPLEIDHVFPNPSPNASYDWGNLLAVCASCHALMDRTGQGAEAVRPEATSSYQMEMAAARTLAAAGFLVTSGVETADSGFDILAVTPATSGSTTTVVVQCKWSSRPIDSSVIEQLGVGVRDMAAQVGLLVTNAALTDAATEVARRTGILKMSLEELAAAAPRLLAEGKT